MNTMFYTPILRSLNIKLSKCFLVFKNIMLHSMAKDNGFSNGYLLYTSSPLSSIYSLQFTNFTFQFPNCKDCLKTWMVKYRNRNVPTSTLEETPFISLFTALLTSKEQGVWFETMNNLEQMHALSEITYGQHYNVYFACLFCIIALSLKHTVI